MTSSEVLVYGATSAGVCAAVAAAEAGAHVVLLEPGRHVGGMTSGGLGYTDIGDSRVLGGFAARFRADVGQWYGVPAGHYVGPEPHVAEAIFLRWLETAGVDVRFKHELRAAQVRDGAIESVAVQNKNGEESFTAATFVDASYEGDLLAAAGVSHAVGREDRSLYGEEFAGRRELIPSMHSMPPWISPFEGNPAPGEMAPLLPQIKPGPLADVGAGDGGVMAYGYRVCLTTADDRLPFEKRDGYDENYWELARRLFAYWDRHGVSMPAGRMIGLEPNLPGGKCDGNSLGPLSLNVLDGAAWEYPSADRQRREELRLHHLHHTQDFLWFMSNDPAVPSEIRTEMQRWGLPREEFADTGHLPHQLYVREARRMLGAYVLTEHDLRGPRRFDDVVAMGSYNIDIREVQRTWQWAYEFHGPVGMAVTEGYLSYPVPPYQIPYRGLIPKQEECRNLIVPVCISASHVAFSSVRMEVQYQMLGHVAGLAAAAAAQDDGEMHRVDIAALQEDLRAAGQVLAL